MKKNLTLLLALLMLAPAAVSCAEDEGTVSEETTAEQTVPAAAVESEPEPEETEEEKNEGSAAILETKPENNADITDDIWEKMKEFD